MTVRYWAAARAAAGVVSEEVPASTLAEAEAEVLARRPGDRRFADVLSCCSVMVGDRPVTTDDPETVKVEPGDTVEFLPPFAGG